ncbi:MAG: hypothetical protein ABEI96_08090 [Haloarculaceae archaeon]
MQTDEDAYRFDSRSLREPSELMQPDRLSSLKQTRLSFTRLLMDRMVREQWDIDVERGDLDGDGVGRLVYRIDTPSQLFSFAVFSHDPGGENTDRIIANNWDMWGFLYEGMASPELMDSQFEELPHVREGRATPDILIWTRSNRSSRYFGHVVESLAAGHQPDIDRLTGGGYLMRSSGYYGNGLNGTKEFKAMDGDHPLKGPYMAQMLSVYMLRIFSYDLAEHMAEARNPDAATLDTDIKRYLGTGNSSGVGIIHYVINHPQLMHAWLRTREIAIARARAVDPSPDEIERFRTILANAKRWFFEDESETKDFFTSKDEIARELDRIEERLDALDADAGDRSLWERLCGWSEDTLGMETQELLHSLLIDVHPEVCAGLESALTVTEDSDVEPGMRVATLRSILQSSYRWALDIDMSRPGAQRYFWYRSIDSEEPRLGIREEHDYEEYGFPIDIARQVQRLDDDLGQRDSTETVAEFLFDHPEYRGIVERVQTVQDMPYAELRANPLDADFVPLSFIACLKAIWGIQKAHPKSKGWVRGTFYQGAPLPEDIRAGDDSYWLYPTKPDRADHWRET